MYSRNENFGFGGSLVRPEAAGYGCLYFVNQMLETKGMKSKGKTVAISGFGNVAWGAALKATRMGAKGEAALSELVVYIYDEAGLDDEKIAYMLELRASNNDVIAPYAKKFKAEFIPGKKPLGTQGGCCACLCHPKRIKQILRIFKNLLGNGMTCVGEVYRIWV